MKFQVPTYISVAAILVLTLLGAGIIVAQSGVQQPRCNAAPAQSPCVEAGTSWNAALPATTTDGCCGALSEEAAPAVSPPAVDAGCCGGSAVYPAYPAANTGCGTAPGCGSIPAVFENAGAPAPGSGGCCGTPPATNGSANVIAASP